VTIGVRVAAASSARIAARSARDGRVVVVFDMVCPFRWVFGWPRVRGMGIFNGTGGGVATRYVRFVLRQSGEHRGAKRTGRANGVGATKRTFIWVGRNGHNGLCALTFGCNRAHAHLLRWQSDIWCGYGHGWWLRHGDVMGRGDGVRVIRHGDGSVG
jgi:hypothetical protein